MADTYVQIMVLVYLLGGLLLLICTVDTYVQIVVLYSTGAPDGWSPYSHWLILMFRLWCLCTCWLVSFYSLADINVQIVVLVYLLAGLLLLIGYCRGRKENSVQYLVRIFT